MGMPIRVRCDEECRMLERPWSLFHDTVRLSVFFYLFILNKIELSTVIFLFCGLGWYCTSDKIVLILIGLTALFDLLYLTLILKIK